MLVGGFSGRTLEISLVGASSVGDGSPGTSLRTIGLYMLVGTAGIETRHAIGRDCLQQYRQT